MFISHLKWDVCHLKRDASTVRWCSSSLSGHYQVILLVIICVEDRRTNSACLNDMIGWQSRSDCSHHGAPWGGYCDGKALRWHEILMLCIVNCDGLIITLRCDLLTLLHEEGTPMERCFGEMMMLFWLRLATMFWLSHCDWSPHGDMVMIRWHFGWHEASMLSTFDNDGIHVALRLIFSRCALLVNHMVDRLSSPKAITSVDIVMYFTFRGQVRKVLVALFLSMEYADKGESEMLLLWIHISQQIDKDIFASIFQVKHADEEKQEFSLLLSHFAAKSSRKLLLPLFHWDAHTWIVFSKTDDVWRKPDGMADDFLSRRLKQAKSLKETGFRH